jgi:hypothetical protein
MTIKAFLNKKQKVHVTKESERCNMTHVMSKKLTDLNLEEVMFLIAILSDDLKEAFHLVESKGFYQDRIKVKK